MEKQKSPPSLRKRRPRFPRFPPPFNGRRTWWTQQPTRSRTQPRIRIRVGSRSRSRSPVNARVGRGWNAADVRDSSVHAVAVHTLSLSLSPRLPRNAAIRVWERAWRGRGCVRVRASWRGRWRRGDVWASEASRGEARHVKGSSRSRSSWKSW